VTGFVQRLTLLIFHHGSHHIKGRGVRAHHLNGVAAGELVAEREGGVALLVTVGTMASTCQSLM
jgi:hypothetical protein